MKKRIFESIGIIGFFVGSAGIAGAIELETSILKPLAVLAIGLIFMFASLKGEENEKNNRITQYGSSSMDASRPYYLRNGRRRA